MVQVAVIGLGNFGYHLATTLYDLGVEVIAIDKDEKLVDAIKDHVSQAIILDATDEYALRDIGIAEVDAGVVAIGSNMQENIMVTTLLRRMGVTKIFSRAMNNLHERILNEVGASKTLRIEEGMAEQVARELSSQHVLHQTNFDAGYSLVEIKPKKEYIGKKIIELKLRENHGVNVAALLRREPIVDEEGKSAYKIHAIAPPNPQDEVLEDDVMVIVGMDAAIFALTR